MKKCSYCAEAIQDEAVKCKHCGEMLSSFQNPNTPKFEKPLNQSLRWSSAYWVIMGGVFFFAIAGLLFSNGNDTGANKKESETTERQRILKKSNDERANQYNHFKNEPIVGIDGGVISYELLGKKVIDTPLKTEVDLSLLILGKPTEANLDKILRSVYLEYNSQTGFRYHPHPTNIYIWAFLTREYFNAQMGQWVAMLEKGFGDAEPSVHMKKAQLVQIDAKPEYRFGMSEKKRREIWSEIIKMEDRMRREAEKAFPNIPLSELSNWTQRQLQERYSKQSAFNDKLLSEGEEELAAKYHLAKEQLDEVNKEGMRKDWPLSS